MIVIGHLSDTHLDSSPEPAERTSRVMRYLHQLPQPPDVVLVTGDIADQGEIAAYQLAAELFAAPYPVLVCPGNHDLRDAYRKGLLGQPAGGDGPINARYDVAGAVFLLCDSTVPGQSGGRLDEQTLGWLDAQLAAVPDQAPVFIAFHHPPVPLHHAFLDSIRLDPAAPLAALIAAHPQVVAVLTGHAHSASVSTFAGRPLLIAPGVSSTLRLSWEGDGPLMTSALPPGVACHILDDAGRLTTHFQTVA